MADYHWTRVQSRDSEKRYNKFETDPDLTECFKINIDWSAYLAAQGVS